MTDPHIAQKKPYVLEETPGKKFWCACGHSKNQPYCDGSHRGLGITPIPVDIEKAGKIAWCGCKHSGTKPFCNGHHKEL